MPEDRMKSKRGNYLRPGRIIDGHKICSVCQKKKPIAEFYRDKYQASGITSTCKKCNNIRCRKWQKGTGRAKALATGQRSKWKKQGIILTLAEYDTKFNSQSGNCAVCKTPQSKLKRRLAVDHNHKTGQVRGLVCISCNYIIGAIESNGHRIIPANKYLKKWENIS